VRALHIPSNTPTPTPIKSLHAFVPVSSFGSSPPLRTSFSLCGGPATEQAATAQLQSRLLLAVVAAWIPKPGYKASARVPKPRYLAQLPIACQSGFAAVAAWVPRVPKGTEAQLPIACQSGFAAVAAWVPRVPKGT
jgi:hypothetical protein